MFLLAQKMPKIWVFYTWIPHPPFYCFTHIRIYLIQWRSDNAEKVTHIKETIGSNNDSLQLRPFSKWELPLGANSFLYEKSIYTTQKSFASPHILGLNVIV